MFECLGLLWAALGCSRHALDSSILHNGQKHIWVNVRVNVQYLGECPGMLWAALGVLWAALGSSVVNV